MERRAILLNTDWEQEHSPLNWKANTIMSKLTQEPQHQSSARRFTANCGRRVHPSLWKHRYSYKHTGGKMKILGSIKGCSQVRDTERTAGPTSSCWAWTIMDWFQTLQQKSTSKKMPNQSSSGHEQYPMPSIQEIDQLEKQGSSNRILRLGRPNCTCCETRHQWDSGDYKVTMNRV